jgi:hypothetical protein
LKGGKKMKNITNYLAAGLIGLASVGCATVPRNVGLTVGNAILAPAKVIKATGEHLNPVRGLREGVIDTAEAAGYLVSGREASRLPHEEGVANTYINERPALRFATDAAFAAGLGGIIGYNSGAGGYSAFTDEALLTGIGIGTASQLGVEGLSYILKKD